MSSAKNRLFYGDNLDVLKQLPTESVDLVYLDPPFNSARNYNVIFARADHANSAGAQIQAFEDTWEWTHETEEQFSEYVNGGLPVRVAEALRAFHTLLGENDALAYLVNMAPRLVQLHRVLKSTGSLYLHCDPTMSHYLKILLDAAFDASNYVNDISWVRSSLRSSISKIYRRAHDVILFYVKDSSAYRFDVQYRELSDASKSNYSKTDANGLYRLVPLLVSGLRNGDTGKVWQDIDPASRGKGGMHWVTKRENLDKYLADERVVFSSSGTPSLKYYDYESPGVPVSDIWDDIKLLSPASKEALGYPTQKPVALLERILEASSRPGDVVLDPFCGCGTTVDAAQKLGRQWIGIDITYIAIDLILKRLEHSHGKLVLDSIDLNGLPRDSGGAQALFDRNPFDFERWAVSFINAQPNEKQVGDKGIDGVARFPLDGGVKNLGRVLVSVKGGKNLNPSMVRDLSGTVNTQKAEMGVLIIQHSATKGMLDEAHHGGTYTHPSTGQSFPRIQIITTDELLAGTKPDLPGILSPYIQAQPTQLSAGSQQLF
ncbi:restriction endonuclease [Salinibacterium sp. SWN139]|uniref:DNA methyltransferase n=1 Tax=Salinibacterium sp. SWN139 TaxID=2792055 RepID=UPI0018CCA678|nr:DNA methyltransferase [Salinibacterium sp. SWN139]MBH0053179.1 restriction endonuclease [Salinibacterium sp. SWN139]